MSSELDNFKEDYINGYIDPYLDRLLELRGIIKKATTFDEISKALDREKQALTNSFPELMKRNAEKKAK